jgi:BirA family transcriptional regulator, biotin operon repressor / biotin---[acetyl-CoA-carboxylase] ligase
MSSPDSIILSELLAAEGNFVSGSRLAELLGISRVSVWSHMERLRSQGFSFEAVRNRGYRLMGQPIDLNPLMIAALLPRRTDPPALFFSPEIDSTNSEAERQLAAGQATPFAVFARKQTAGRGRMGRSWHSEDNGNLYLSCAFRPRLEPARMQTFTLWMGVNVCQALRNFTQAEVAVKWPNDLLANGRKLGGMLTEARIDADQMRDVVFGLGLNVNSPSATWPAEIATTAISLAEAVGRPMEINRLAAAVIGRIFHAFDRFNQAENNSELNELWNRFDALRGKTVETAGNGETIAGVADGIDERGSLRVRQADGSIRLLRAGEVSLKKPLPTR